MNEPQPKANMIEQVQAYKVGDKTFSTFEEAQLDALTTLFSRADSSGSAAIVAGFVRAHAAEILLILTMSEPAPKTRKPRSDQGKPHRKKKSVPTDPKPASCGVKIEASEKYAGK